MDPATVPPPPPPPAPYNPDDEMFEGAYTIPDTDSEYQDDISEFSWGPVDEEDLDGYMMPSPSNDSMAEDGAGGGSC